MSEVAQFSSYVGLVVLISAAILLSPRATVATWAGLTGWFRNRWQDVVAWRPRTERAEPLVLPVDVRVGARFRRHDPEVLEPDAPEGARRAALELWGHSRERLETGAVALALVAVALRSAGTFVDVLPEPAVLAGDLLLVLATYLLMARVIRYFPAELLPSAGFPRRAHPGRLPATGVRRQGRLDHGLALVASSLGLFVVLAWPVELGAVLGELRFGSASAGVLVAWALELPWLVAVGAFLVRTTALGTATRPAAVAAQLHAVPDGPVVLPRRSAATALEDRPAS